MTTIAASHTPEVGPASRLIDEAERYLETVELFRSLGYEPTWQRDEEFAVRAVELITPYLGGMTSRLSGA
ncbi:MAG TPA: hypothetical protein VFK76_00215 [Gaiellaceae bacterium]|nr:hypothetical protein [Gaiellaceae bacterium]